MKPILYVSLDPDFTMVMVVHSVIIDFSLHLHKECTASSAMLLSDQMCWKASFILMIYLSSKCDRLNPEAKTGTINFATGELSLEPVNSLLIKLECLGQHII